MSPDFYKIVHLTGLLLVFMALGGLSLHAINGGTREDNRGRRLVALTYCAMCRTVVPFDVTDIGPLFVASFKNANMVMADRKTRTFFQQATGVNLDQDSLKTLEQRTEGWVASLQLATIAVQAPQGQPDESNINRLVKSFSGTHQYIVDYLLSEVMTQRPSGTRQFLLQTSILDRFTPSLCAAVTGQKIRTSKALLKFSLGFLTHFRLQTQSGSKP